MNWISVEDRLPETETDTLAFFRNGSLTWYEIAFVDENKQWRDQAEDLIFGATHWMPLPDDPPKEQEDD